MTKTIRIATRPSLLAVTQTKWVADRLAELNPEYNFQIITFRTKGDIDNTSSLTSFGGTGLFVKELEQALLNNEADIAVHSLKDVPSAQPQGLSLVAFPTREKPNDVLLTRNNLSLFGLKQGAIVGTGSPRRVLQFSLLRPDVKFKEIRGNIDSRIKKMQSGEYDAIILAAAGIKRLDKRVPLQSVIKTSQMIPAIGQGILGIEARTNDANCIAIADTINDISTMHEAFAERIFMKIIEGGCKFPLAAFAQATNIKMNFEAIIGDLNTKKYIKKNIVTTITDYPTAIEELALEMKQIAISENINMQGNN